jgi:hypothetical protein
MPCSPVGVEPQDTRQPGTTQRTLDRLQVIGEEIAVPAPAKIAGLAEDAGQELGLARSLQMQPMLDLDEAELEGASCTRAYMDEVRPATAIAAVRVLCCASNGCQIRNLVDGDEKTLLQIEPRAPKDPRAGRNWPA